jgi:predicted ATPase/DNA-binding winged helix-turn-helix (wHTH) protein
MLFRIPGAKKREIRRRPIVTGALANEHPRSFAFGPFVLIPERQLLLAQDVPVRIGGRALDILTVLVEHPGELVSKGDLIARVWPDTIVEEGNLKVNMAALRRVLGEQPGEAPYIATVVGRGYRFVGSVRSFVQVARPFEAGEAPVRSHNLPTGTTPIFGRADAIEAIRRDLEESRLVSIVGAGGIGKTTVALAVAEHAVGRQHFTDGVWLVEVGLQRDPAWVPNAIATAIGAAVNSADMLSGVVEFLGNREILLVLDNCEHVIHGAAICIDRILSNTPGVKILTTTREPLRMKRERVRRLPGLGAPPPSAQLSAAEASTFPAIQLFVDRATNRLDSFSLSDADAPTVAEICRRLDGLALAIELAASRIDAFGVGGLLNQLDDRFRLLVGRRAGPERHRTLMATLDWSYSLLSEGEAALLRAVCVFAGVFDIDGASAVANVPPVETADVLAQLAAKSLLATDLDGAGIAYRLLETTRTYCLERLRGSAEEQAVRQRHAAHVCAVLEQATAEWAERPASEWALEYGRVLDDLRNALAWTGQDSAQRSLRVTLTVAGLLLWNHFSLTEECRIHVARAVEDLDGAALAGTALEMKLKMWLGGSTMITRGFKAQALAAMRRALEIAIQTDDTDYRLRCLSMIGIYELWTGEHEAGLSTLGSFANVAAANDPSALPEGEVHSGIAELFLGRLEQARQRLEPLQQRDLRYFKGSYGVRYLADTVVLLEGVLSHIQWLTGFPDTAARTAVTAIERGRPTHHHLSLNNALSYACPVFYWSGRYEECGRHVALLDDHVVRHGLVARRPVAMFYRAALDCLQNRESSAGLDGLEHAIEEFRSINHLARMPYYLSVVADALAQRSRLGEAETTIRAALDSAQAQREAWCLPELLRVQASISAAAGQADQAESLLIESMGVAQRIGARSWRLRAASDLAALWRARSRTDTARALLLPIFNEFTEGFATRDLVVAAGLLA